MKLIDLLLAALLLSLSVAMLSGSVRELHNLELAISETGKKATSIDFISESFRKTCRGEGFANLEEWSRTSKGLWELEEISFEIFEENKASKEKLMKGIWTGPHGSGEVFCRIREKGK
jgi:hypothetical protein